MKKELQLTLFTAVKVGSENYPESTAYAIFTRAPALFTSVWNVVSKFLPARSVKKVRFINHADTPYTLMKYIQPDAIVALQRLTWGGDGDQIADDVESSSAKSFERTIQVPARSSEFVFVALQNGQKLSFRLFEGDTDLTGFAEVLYVDAAHHESVSPEEVDVRTETPNAKGYAACPPEAKNCLVVITCDNTGSWFSAKALRVDVQIA